VHSVARQKLKREMTFEVVQFVFRSGDKEFQNSTSGEKNNLFGKKLNKI